MFYALLFHITANCYDASKLCLFTQLLQPRNISENITRAFLIAITAFFACMYNFIQIFVG